MQLAENPNAYEASNFFTNYYFEAVYMIDFIDNPRPKHSSPSFEYQLGIIKRDFPLFNAHCQETKPQLHTMSAGERRDLKLKLLDELKAKKEKTMQKITEAKMFRDIVLPSTIDESIDRLRGIINEKTDENWAVYEKVAENQREIAVCRHALQTMHSMRMDNNHMAAYIKELFTSMPKEQMKQGRAGKRRRIQITD